MSERYTVFEEGFEEQATDHGLSVKDAFSLIMQRCDYVYGFERCGSDYVLTTWQRRHAELGTREERSTLPDDHAAKREIMLKSFDGRFKAFYAMPDGEFEKHRLQTLAQASHEQEYVEQTAVKDRAHLRVVKK